MNQQNPHSNQNASQNHSQSPQNQYPINHMQNNDGNFKKNRPSGQGTPVTSTNLINTSSQVSQNSQQSVGTNSNYIPNTNNQISQQPPMNTTNNTNPNIQVQHNQQLQQIQQGSKISEEHKSIL